MTAPEVSVVMATYGRGRHILPSIRSVLGQTLPGWELLVVGDACTDETEAVVCSVGDPRVRWLNLERRVGSQSGPNNAGIAAATGRLIAYLGHDDIWEPDHLKRLVDLFLSDDPPDFAVSGAIYHMPDGLPGHHVTGVFPDGADVSRYFFPPSSFAHTRVAATRLGSWNMPLEIRAPVDEDLLLRAVSLGLRFRSTGVVTVHKFAAGHRYLSYLHHESREQEEMLQSVRRPDHGARIEGIVEAARKAGHFMISSDRSFEHFAPGELARSNAARKGLRPIAPVPLGRGLTLRHGVEDSVMHWRNAPKLGFRRNWLSPRPRLLVAVSGGRARLRFTAACRDARALGTLVMLCNGERLEARPGWRWFGLIAWFARYEAEIALRSDGPTVLELQLSEAQRPIRRRRLAIGPLRLTPI